MNIRVGQKVAYPNHGVCRVEAVESKDVGARSEKYYTLRVLSNNSSILVPKDKAETIGIRPIISTSECVHLIDFLAEDFENPSCDWKIRSREFLAKFQTGDVFEVADVLKKLKFLTLSKTLSFREQRMFEKAKFLVVSELAIVCSKPEETIEEKVENCLNNACEKHCLETVNVVSNSVH